MGQPSDLHLVRRQAVRLDEAADDPDHAVWLCGSVLREAGAVTSSYVTSMLDRERWMTTYAGNGVAVPRGAAGAENSVLHDAVCFLRFRNGVDWGGGHMVRICIGVAMVEPRRQLAAVLLELDRILRDPGRSLALHDAPDVDTVLDLLRPLQFYKGWT